MIIWLHFIVVLYNIPFDTPLAPYQPDSYSKISDITNSFAVFRLIMMTIKWCVLPITYLFDTFTRTPVRVSKMNAVARAQLTFQILTLLEKYNKFTSFP